MAESNGLITSPPAFLMSLASPFFRPKAAVDLAAGEDEAAVFAQGHDLVHGLFGVFHVNLSFYVQHVWLRKFKACFQRRFKRINKGFFRQAVEKPQTITLCIGEDFETVWRKKPVQPSNKAVNAGAYKNALSLFLGSGRIKNRSVVPPEFVSG